MARRGRVCGVEANFYSTRRAVTGLMEAARCAGMMLAKRAQAREREDGYGKDQGIPALDLVELRSDESGAPDGDGNADEQPDEDLQEGSAKDQANDAAAVCAEGHANADLTGSALDGVGGDAIESHSGEDEGEDAEEAGHLRDGALLLEAVRDLVIHAVDVNDGEVGIDLGEDAAHLRLQALDVVVAEFEDHALDKVGAIVDHLHHGRVVVDVLSQGDEEEGPSPVAAGVGVVGLADHAHDFKDAVVLHEVDAEVGADGLLTLLKKLAHKRLVDDGDLAGGGGVLLGDGAAAEDVLAHEFEIAGADVIPGGADVGVHIGRSVCLRE